jgi:hypothetical protein
MRGSTGALLDGEAGSGAAGQRMDTCLALCHGLKHVLVGTRYAGYRQRHPAFCLGSMQTCLYCSRESQRAHFPIWGPSGPDLHDFGWVTGVICAALASSSALKASNVKGISELSGAMGNQRLSSLSSPTVTVAVANSMPFCSQSSSLYSLASTVMILASLGILSLR